MATDAVFTFNFIDDVHLLSFYKKTDAFQDDMIKFLFTEFSNMRQDECPQFGNIVARLVSCFVIDRNDTNRAIKICEPIREGDQSFISRFFITPIDGKFSDIKINLVDSLHVKIYWQRDMKLEMEGTIRECMQKMSKKRK